MSDHHLSLLLRTSQLLGSSLEIQQVLDTLMAQVVEVLGAERGFILVRHAGEGDWSFRTACALDAETMAQDDFRISRSIADRVAGEGKSILTSDALEDERFRGQASVALYNLRSILCVPLVISGSVLGLIYVDHRLASGAFDQEARELLEAIAGQAAMAVQNALLVDKLKSVYESSLEQARAELAATQDQLFVASKMAAVGQLAAGVAHEINNPLGALALNLSSLKSQASEPIVVKRLSLCEGAVERCRNIVSGLLTFAQTRPRGTLAAVDLSEAITSTLELVESDLSRVQVRLVRELTPGLMLEADPTELTQIVLNLVLNARDCLADCDRPEGRTVWVRTRREPGALVAEVTDNGPGMSPEVQERIFEPFFTTKEVGKGVGLGLSICYQLTQRNGGEIQVESRPGQGTRFKLVFPC